ncbi:MAG: hypothetical protein R6V05_12255 [Candidatus Brocadiia bacterium]
MIEEIIGPGHGGLDRLSRSEEAGARRADGEKATSDGEQEPSVEVSSELKALIERVKQAGTYRKERVHQVLEKLQRGELVTSETVREAAERILREGP